MQRKLKGSVTVEAALLYPFLLLITFLLVRLTLGEYAATGAQAADLCRTVFTGRRLQAPEIIRASEAVFDFFN